MLSKFLKHFNEDLPAGRQELAKPLLIEGSDGGTSIGIDVGLAALTILQSPSA